VNNICYKPRRFSVESEQRISQANAIINEYLSQGFRLTLRQLYYQFVSRGLIANTVQNYKNLGSIINDGRLAGMIDWDSIEDRTRNLQSQSVWNNPQEIVSACAQQFRTDRWKEQPRYIEIWIEKDALAGIIEGVCKELRVPFFACRGYTSQSEMWAAAMRLCRHEQEEAQECHIIHLGDHDPSGIDMTRDIIDRLKIFGSEVEIHRIALNRDQVDKYNPPPNPAKMTDSRYTEYERIHGDESWELDALEPAVIVDLIRETIADMIDMNAWRTSEIEEDMGREQLRYVTDNWTKVTKRKKK
jgi:hypothetical protein